MARLRLARAEAMSETAKLTVRLLTASFKKFIARMALKMSSVNLVATLIRLLVFVSEQRKRNSDVQTPVHEYRGKKGSPDAFVKEYSDDVNASVRPVGPRNVMGCPANTAYSIPDKPHDTMNWTTPMVPSVSRFVRPPKAIVGARHAKYKKRMEARLFLWRPSVQSDR